MNCAPITQGCRRVAPDYASDLSVPILDRGRNAKEREIGSSTMCRPNYYNYYIFNVFKRIPPSDPHVKIVRILDLKMRILNSALNCYKTYLK